MKPTISLTSVFAFKFTVDLPKKSSWSAQEANDEDPQQLVLNSASKLS